VRRIPSADDVACFVFRFTAEFFAQFENPFCSTFQQQHPMNRMNDNGKDGFDECVKMQSIVDGLGSETRILVASIRDADTLTDLATEGLDTYTFSPAVARELFDEKLTDDAAAEFEEAAARGGTNSFA
jgi:transaldolase